MTRGLHAARFLLPHHKENLMTLDAHDSLETKAGYSPDGQLSQAHVTHGDLMRTFEAFKAANDERLDAIERRSADALQEEKACGDKSEPGSAKVPARVARCGLSIRQKGV
jgi:hypothetical protein